MSDVAIPASTAPTTLDADSARRLTERIRYTALSVRDGMEKLQRLVQEAKNGEAHEALGYASWTAYLSDVLGAEPLRLPRDQRQELVGYLSGEGMSTRAIAPIVGVSDRTVSADMQVRSDFAPAPVASRPTVDPDTGEVGEDYPLPAPVTGLDGKTYTRPAAATPPTEPKRRALTDQFFDAAYDLGKAVERVHRITQDDRFSQNADKVAAKHRSDLVRLNNLLTEVINQLS